MNVELPPGWIAVSSELAANLEAELHRELPKGHQLCGRQLRAIARRQDQDDVLFRSATDDGSLFCVHLTWSKERDPQWPWTVRYASLDDFRERWLREELGADPSG